MILLFDQGTMHGVLTIFAEILHCNCILTKENFGEFQTLVMHTMQGIEIDEDVLQPHSMMTIDSNYLEFIKLNTE